MTKTDLAKKHEMDRAEWQKRGIAGTVSAVDAAARKITVTQQGNKTITVVADDKTSYRRYAPDSIHWDDALPGKFDEIRAGDRINALGDKNADGTEIAAQNIVSGSFLTIGGKVVSVDAQNSEIKLNDLTLKKPVSIKVNGDHTTLRRLQPQIAYMLARRLNPTYQVAAGSLGTNPGGAGGPGGAPGTTPRIAAEAQRAGGPVRTDGQRQGFPGGQGGPGGPGGFGGGRPPDLGQMLERQPVLALNELKPGDALIIYSTQGADRTRLNAITVLAGVEPILEAAPRTFGEANGISSWNLDTSGPAQ